MNIGENMLFVPKKIAIEARKELKKERAERRKERNKKIRAKALKYSQEFDRKHRL